MTIPACEAIEENYDSAVTKPLQAARCNQHTKQNTKRNVDEITSNKAKHGKMKADNNNKKPKVMKEQPYRHKYSFDATLKRSIPVVNAEEQVRAIVVC